MPHYIIYCDGSADSGQFYSDFYGGALVDARDRESLEHVLAAAKGKCQGEMKWTKISEYNEADYIELIDAFFDLVRDGFIKVRIMFTQNINHVPKGTYHESEIRYFKLYYQFVKHAFGLRFCNPGKISNVYVSLFLDQVPDTKVKFESFKDYMSDLSNFPVLKSQKVVIKRDEIIDVDSKKHTLLQCVDIVLGAMQFRLNEGHKYIAKGQKRRGKRTKSKERVYKFINKRIQEIYPKFNVGITTGQTDGPAVRWSHSYRHWCFVPNQSKIDLTRGKRANKKAPHKPT